MPGIDELRKYVINNLKELGFEINDSDADIVLRRIKYKNITDVLSGKYDSKILRVVFDMLSDNSDKFFLAYDNGIDKENYELFMNRWVRRDNSSINRDEKSSTINNSYDSKRDLEIANYIKWYFLEKHKYDLKINVDIEKFIKEHVEGLKINGLYDALYKDIKSVSSYVKVSNIRFENYMSHIIMTCKRNGIISLDEDYKCMYELVKLKLSSELSKYYDFTNARKFLDESCFDLCQYLLFNGYNYIDLINNNSECVRIIDEFILNKKLYLNSVDLTRHEVYRKDTSSSKNKKNRHGITIDDIVTNRILVRTVAGILAAISIGSFVIFKKVNEHKTQTADIEVVEVIKSFDNYEYPIIKNSDTGAAFPEALIHLKTIFPEYFAMNVSDDDHYEQIPLFLVYKSIDMNMANKLNMMDSILMILKGDLQNKDYYSRTKETPEYNAIKGYDSYVVYVYYMLHYAGIDVSPYNDAVASYVKMMDRNMTSGNFDNVYLKLSTSQQRDINKMMDDYTNYVNTVLEKKFANSLSNNRSR